MIYGQTYSVAGGILHYIGGVISSTANAFSFQVRAHVLVEM